MWEDFKIRLGTSDFDRFAVDPALFVQGMDNLHYLEASFLQEEIDITIKSLPNNKSPNPDGFNIEFLK